MDEECINSLASAENLQIGKDSAYLILALNQWLFELYEMFGDAIYE